ncbi:MAG: AraC family transcriptional regulator [Hyphomicrobiales bacterium]|nr:MAG: AraC family transcriptional regulator [Hyphomicrobiales bacterium]
MLTLPKIVERPATYYAGVPAEVTMPFDAAIGPLMGEAAAYLAGAGVRDFGPALFKYDVIDMPRLEMQFGFATPGPVNGSERVSAGTIPAGRYATLTYTGPYDDLESVTAVLIGWARQKGIEWDSTATAAGERFVSRLEIYLNGPDDEPDPQKLVTEIWIKVRG